MSVSYREVVGANERKVAFKALIRQRMDRENGAVSKADLVEYVQSKRPDLCDDTEPCYPGCDSHPALWRHQLERCIYDLKSLKQPFLASDWGHPGWYVRA